MPELDTLIKTLNTHQELMIDIKAVPGSSRSEIVGFLGKDLKIKVAAPPEKGKANDEILIILANTFHVHTNQIQIIKGHTSARKRIRISLKNDI